MPPSHAEPPGVDNPGILESMVWSQLGVGMAVVPSVVAVRLVDAHEIGAGHFVPVVCEGEGALQVVVPGIYDDEYDAMVSVRGRVVEVGVEVKRNTGDRTDSHRQRQLGTGRAKLRNIACSWPPRLDSSSLPETQCRCPCHASR